MRGVVASTPPCPRLRQSGRWATPCRLACPAVFESSHPQGHPLLGPAVPCPARAPRVPGSETLHAAREIEPRLPPGLPAPFPPRHLPLALVGALGNTSPQSGGPEGVLEKMETVPSFFFFFCRPPRPTHRVVHETFWRAGATQLLPRAPLGPCRVALHSLLLP